MEQHLDTVYGSPQTIRYLVNSIDDLREIVDTVLYIVRHNSRPDDYLDLKQTISLSGISMPQSLSSFIIGFDMPGNLLRRTPRVIVPVSDGIRQAEAADCLGFPEPEFHVVDNWSHLSFDLRTLNDLYCALNRTTWFLKRGSKRFEYINLKLRTRLVATPTDPYAKGLNLTFKVPIVLQRA